MKGNNFHYRIGGLVPTIPIQTINAATVNGTEIIEPWREGNQVVFFFMGGAWPATTDFRLRVQGKRRDTGAWENMKGADNLTDLEFTQTKLDDGGAGENGALIGTLPLARVDAETYGSVRCTLQNTQATAAVAGVAAFVFDLLRQPSSTPDELFDQTLNVA